jgi:hypothetical protein
MIAAATAAWALRGLVGGTPVPMESPARAIPMGMARTKRRAKRTPVPTRYTQPGNLNDAIRVLQLKVPLTFRYSSV